MLRKITPIFFEMPEDIQPIIGVMSECWERGFNWQTQLIKLLIL